MLRVAIFAAWSEILTKSDGNIVNKNPHIAKIKMSNFRATFEGIWSNLWLPHKNWYVCMDERNFEIARIKNVA